MSNNNTQTTPQKNGGSIGKKRRASRLGAIQSLYAIEVGGLDRGTVTAEFIAAGCVADLGDETIKGEQTLYQDIVGGVVERGDELSDIVGNALRTKALKDCEIILQKIFLCGAYELVARGDIEARLTIAEYVSITDAFFGGKEPQLVNGVLNGIAQVVRSAEMNS